MAGWYAWLKAGLCLYGASTRTVRVARRDLSGRVVFISQVITSPQLPRFLFYTVDWVNDILGTNMILQFVYLVFNNQHIFFSPAQHPLIRSMRWGLVPSTHRKPVREFNLSTHNCCSESITERPIYNLSLIHI